MCAVSLPPVNSRSYRAPYIDLEWSLRLIWDWMIMWILMQFAYKQMSILLGKPVNSGKFTGNQLLFSGNLVTNPINWHSS